MHISSLDDPRNLVKTLHNLFGKGGYLSKVLPQFEWRPQQEEMAQGVARALQGGKHLLVEAGTGTGKTYAYLIPAILTGRKVVVSTGSKTLQDQLMDKDLPFLQRHLPIRFHAVSLKGKSNYLCLYRYKRFGDGMRFGGPADADLLEQIHPWVATTRGGERSELADLPEGHPLWEELSVQGEDCLGRECPEWDCCYLVRARQEAAAADLLVVNHHLFLADLALKEDRHGQVLPHYEAVILDEAHQLEEVATYYFGVSVSSFRVQALCRDALREDRYAGRHQQGGAMETISLERAAAEFFAAFRQGSERYRLDPSSLASQYRSLAGPLMEALDYFSREHRKKSPRREGYVHLADRAEGIRADLSLFFDPHSTEHVFWCEVRERGVALSANPLKVADHLGERLFSRGQPVILTSATLATGRSFQYIQGRLGLRQADGLLLDSPFSLSDQALLYVPRYFPGPQTPGFWSAAAEEMERLVRISRGRALLLFTSRRGLQEVYQRLEERLPYPLLRQGEQPKGMLLDRFRREVPSVLFGTASFWQGVDIPGEALSCLVIDKLPFSPPSDPLVDARLQYLREQGFDPFLSYQLPVAVLTLKQGLGRLIRHRKDRGIMAILDVRLRRKAYGERILRDLPAFRMTDDLSDLDAFLNP